MAVSKRLRFEILRRDGFRCTYCGSRPSDGAELHVDHVVPQALGGTDDPSNLTTSCADCNAGKSSSSPTEEQIAAVDAADLTWRSQVAAALERIKIEHAEREALVDAFAGIWDAWHWTDRTGNNHTFGKAANWRSTVSLMLDRGMDLEHLDMCVDIAMAANPKDEWAYFCGVVWRVLKQAQGGE